MSIKDDQGEEYSDILSELDKEEERVKLRMKMRKGEDLGPAMCVSPFAVSPEQEKDIAEEDRTFHEFMKGYHREVIMTGRVLSSLVRAMDAYPSLRLGQLLYAVINETLSIGPDLHPSEWEQRIGNRLFAIYDKDLIRALDKFTEEKEKK